MAESRVASDSLARARREDSLLRARPGYIIDSALARAEEFRRFVADLPSRPTRLANGAPTRNALIQAWIDAVERNDSVRVIRMAVNRGEFALLVYPTSPDVRPPRRQSPAIAWTLLGSQSAQGYRRTMGRLGGAPLNVVGWRCPAPVERQGANRIWSDCRLRRVLAAGDTVEQRLFGPIIARDGIFKFVSLTTAM